MKNRIFISFLIIFAIAICHGQDDVGLVWQNCIGGSEEDQFGDFVQLEDSTYIIVGYGSSYDGDFDGTTHGRSYIVRLDQDGTIIWADRYGNGHRSRFFSVIETPDNNILIAGDAYESGYDVPETYGHDDVWLLKIDIDGNILWSKCYGGSSDDKNTEMKIISDGNIILSGYTYSSDFDCDSTRGEADGWVLKLNQEGEIIWSKQIGGRRKDYLYNFTELDNGNLVFVGHSESNDGIFDGNHGYCDTWILMLDPDGNIIWNKLYGGNYSDYFNCVTALNNNEILVAGHTESNDYDIPSDDPSYSWSSPDAWVAKLDSSGNIIDSKLYGDYSGERISDLIHVSDSVIYILGEAFGGTPGDFILRHESYEYLIFRINSSLSLKWYQSYGGNYLERCKKGILCNDGGLLLGGTTESYNTGDITGSHMDTTEYSEEDTWIIKLEPNLKIKEYTPVPQDISIECYPNPFNSKININFSKNIDNCEIYSIDGKMVYTSPQNSSSISWTPESNIETGVYLLKIGNEAFSVEKKLIYIK